MSAPDPALPMLVRRLRLQKGMSQEALAFTADVTASTLSRIERGRHRPTPNTLKRIARALGVSPAELIAAAESDARRQSHNGE